MEVKHPDSNSFPRILIAEDERITAHHLRHVLTRFGYEVVAVASSGQLPIEEADRKTPGSPARRHRAEGCGGRHRSGKRVAATVGGSQRSFLRHTPTQKAWNALGYPHTSHLTSRERRSGSSALKMSGPV